MIVSDATDADIERVVRNMRAADAFEVYSGRFDKSPEALMIDLMRARRVALGLLALCRSDGLAVALLGALLEAPARASVLMIATDEWPSISLAATRYAKRVAIPVYLGGVRSAECRCWDGNHASRRWLEALGFSCAAELPQHDDQGSTFLLYRWIAPETQRLRDGV